MRRSKRIHTFVMNPPPTVIVMTASLGDQPRAPTGAGGAMANFSTLDTTLRRVISSGLPMLLVAPEEQAEEAIKLLPRRDILISGDVPAAQSKGDWLVSCLASAVMTRAHANGWIVLPADMPMLQSHTLHELAHKLTLGGPIVFPTYRHVRGHPVAFAAELYSELVRMDSEHSLRRLAARYPSAEIEVDDPGVLMTLQAQSALTQLRAQLGGPALHQFGQQRSV